MTTPHLITCDDGRTRCWWCGEDERYQAYHDDEWGVPVEDDRRLFEKICLEGFQSGLSWLTILNKRENFRSAFRNFDFEHVARFTEKDVARLLRDAGIVRHRGKIEATINNAQAALALVDEFGSLSNFFWQYATDNTTKSKTIPSQTKTSKALATELKRRSWSFVGPTTCYAFMQAMGMVNDHLAGCFVNERVSKMRAKVMRTRAKK